MVILKQLLIIKIKLFFLLFMILNKSFSVSINETLLLSSSIRGIPLAEGTISLKLKKKKYSVMLNAKSVGVFSIILDWSQEIRSFGRIEKNNFYSYRYFSSDQRGNKNGHIEIAFESEPPKIISAKPDPKEDIRRVMDNSLLFDVNDPVAGIFNLALNKCEFPSKIFDGKRLYSIRTSKLKSSVLNDLSYSEDNLNSYKCNYETVRIAGYTDKELKNFPKKGEIWIKRHQKYNFFYPVKIQIPTKWGNFVCFISERSI